MAARFLDMALDDVVKSRTSNNRSPASRRGMRGAGGRDSPNRSNRSSPYSRNTSDDRWTHDKFEEANQRGGGRGAGAAPSNDGNSKITVENLHYAVTLEDIKELFETHAGPVKFAEVKYDLSGRSTGVATVLFKTPGNAAVAIKKLHGIELDGQPMKITYAPLPARTQEKRPGPAAKSNSKRDVFSRLGSSEADIASRLGRLNPAPKATPQGSLSSGGRKQQGGGGGGGGGGGQGKQAQQKDKKKPHVKTAEELDAEMDTYMGDA
ncbi:hypothetical protein BG011_002840 [Mortierella polycephala]|uniref:RRM domain-containing protein n=1 Tax=Mortierella polycephala TaxID=41804 RepID=A0A9P6U3N1_9FUNG|nr:hypothetical protein BG011_002840 [Mortierella polycephala]